MRFIRALHKVDPDLVVPKLPGRPPPGFPRTAIGGHAICARCNSRRGCDESLCFTTTDGEVITLEYALSDPRTLRDEERTHALLDAALAAPRCKYGFHEKVGSGTAFQSYFGLPGLGGFRTYRDIDDKTGRTAAFEGVAAAYDSALVREHVAHTWLENQLNKLEGVPREACRAARDEQAELIVSDSAQKMSLNLTWSRRRRRCDGVLPRRRRRGRQRESMSLAAIS